MSVSTTRFARSLRLGLTGGMGCGKSTVAELFRELGFGVVNSDELVRELLTGDAAVGAAITARWGGRVAETSGTGSMERGMRKSETRPAGMESSRDAASAIRAPYSAYPLSRRKIAEIVFADPAELAWLEELLHPRVRVRWEAAMAAAPERDWVAEIPLLFEKSLASHFDFTLCVWAHPSVQARRLAARGLPPAEIAARQARQWPLEDKAARADFVVGNDGGEDFLRRQVIRLAERLRRP